ncbi:MAG: hypothetical protein LBD49_06480 [Oscillospiraceae bacterium]|jgi:flagellar motility protein MotE (MotC chaperone)|nr:hypothetical protein [Oscillospiraceae bacterium]
MAAKAETAEGLSPPKISAPRGGAIDLPAPGTGKAEASEKKPSARKRKDGKPRRVSAAIIIAGSAAALVIAFAVLVAATDIFGLRGKLLRAMAGLDPEFTGLETRAAELDERETSLNSREARVEIEQARLEAEREDLASRERELDAAEDARTPLYRQPMSPQDIEDMKALAAVYQAMDPESAAEILSMLYTADRSAAILYYMSGKTAAAVLSAMAPELAAEITETLLSK